MRHAPQDVWDKVLAYPNENAALVWTVGGNDVFIVSMRGSICYAMISLFCCLHETFYWGLEFWLKSTAISCFLT